jgi:hypothetical protein
MKEKHDVLARFVNLLEPLIAVYTIPRTSLQIFTDKEGRFISFNRGGNIFLNLRYFEEWRTSCISALLLHPIFNCSLLDDNDVKQDNLCEALTFWYAFPLFLDCTPC